MAQNVARINFALNVGEVSARFEARQDKVEKYSSACRQLDNWLPLTMGGVTRRPGWAYVAKAKYSGLANAGVRMVEFRFSSDQAYALEFGDLYVRFYKDDAPLMDPDTPSIPHELVTPWALADLDLIKIGSFQSADVMYICSGIYPIYKLARIETSPDRFTLSAVAFNPPATQLDEPLGTEIGSGDITLSALTGSAQTITATNAIFLAGDVGRTITSDAGRAVITALNTPSIVAVDIISDFNSLVIVQGDWHFSGFGDVEMDPNRRLAGASVIIDASVATFRSTDAGKYMTIYGGLVKLESYVGPTQMNGTILNTMRDVPNDPSTGLPYNDPPATTVWAIEVEAWTDVLGYPNCGCFFQSRMWLCKGQTINGSVTGDFENFSKGSNADDAIQRTIDDDQVNPIRWIKGLRSLQIGTGGSAYEVTASSAGKALTPSDFTVLPISSRGSANIPPIRIGGQLIHVQFGAKKIRELVFDFVTDKFKSPSLLTLAEHLTEENYVTDMAFQQEPDSIIWCVRDDGMLLAFTYQEDENVIGWSKHPTAGEVKTVCTIPRPSTGKDWLWASIERDINGVTETFIEQMEADANVTREWHGLQTDCALIVVPDANLLVTGLDHLEGETVRVIGDGMLFHDALVTSGSFTLSPAIAVSEVEVGLDYQSEGLTCEPPIPPDQGGMFLCRRWKALGMRVRHAGPGLTLNVDDSADVGLPIRKSGHPMDEALPLQEGKLCTEQTNYGPFCRVLFKQTLPFPAEIMNIVGDFEISTEWCCDTVDESTGISETIVPPVPPTGCPDSEPGQQTLAVVCCYDGNSVWSNPCGTISYVAADHSFWATSSEQSGFGQGPYPVSSPLMWRLWEPDGACNLVDITATDAVPMPGGFTGGIGSTQAAQAGWCGKSDEKSYCLRQSSISPSPEPSATTHYGFTYFGEQTGVGVFMGLTEPCFTGTEWTKYGNDFYSLVDCSGANLGRLARWTMPLGGNEVLKRTLYLGGVPVPTAPFPGLTSLTNIHGMQATANFLYVGAYDSAGGHLNPKIFKLDKTTLDLIDTIEIDDANFFSDPSIDFLNFHVFSDDLIFLLSTTAVAGGTDLHIGWVNPNTAVFTLIDTVPQTCIDFYAGSTSASQTSQFFYRDNHFWLSSSGGDVVKIGELLCPSDPTMPWENE